MNLSEQIRELYAGSYRRMVVQLYAITGDLGEAQDAVQEAFTKALIAPKRLAARDNPEAWVRRVAVNLARNRWRRRRTLNRLLRGRELRPRDVPGASPDHVALVDAMRQLPEGQRVVIALHYIGDLPITEIAVTVGVSEGTVKSRLSRGRAALAAALDEHVDELPASPALQLRQEISHA
ncbi:MAG: sigma-70 family RNA polymerase sigma factor [Micromonosporaceae bacterium]